MDRIEPGGKVLPATHVPYKDSLALAVPPTPKIMVLIERGEGEVKFVQKIQKKE